MKNLHTYAKVVTERAKLNDQRLTFHVSTLYDTCKDVFCSFLTFISVIFMRHQAGLGELFFLSINPFRFKSNIDSPIHGINH